MKGSHAVTKMEQTVSPPWDAWKLDKTFFRNLSQYSASHPETTLNRVLDRIRIGLEDNKPLFSLIPDAPFPARSLTLALAHLIKLGVTVHRAQATVCEFAEQVVAWVINIKNAFESTAGGHFVWTTWKNLGKMRFASIWSYEQSTHWSLLRDLIDEICRWANARLCDKRWSRIGNGMMIANEIAEFNTRINEAQMLFTNLTLINLSGGIDAIIGGLWMLLQRQDNIRREIKKIREKQREQFLAAKLFILNEMEVQKQAEARRLFLSRKLSPWVVANPMYDQQGKLPCDEDTRTQVLADIRSWIDDISANSPNFLWLTGDPGCGKSAITASIARECKDNNTLWAQYFINRNNIETTDPNFYFPSIARQFADHSTDVELSVHDALKRKPSLMDRISPDQAAKLFVDAISVASELYPNRPVVVVIDGLDETERDRLKDTATIFARLFQSLSDHRNVKVLVSSRTEDDIRNPFARYMDTKFVKHIYLDTADKSSIDDVSAFLRRKIAQIVEENDLNWEDWPGDQRMEALTQRASGLFIWAVTATKFIQEQIDTMGSECLNDVLDMLDTGTLGDINTLYSIILRQTYKAAKNAWEYEKFRLIVGAIVTLCEPLRLEDLSILLDLRRTPESSPVDIVTFVRRLRTVLVAGTNAIDQKTIPRLHKSFYEFVTSPSAEDYFRIDLNFINGELAVRCLSQFHDADTITTCDPWTVSALPPQLRYALRFWSNHLQKAKGTIGGFLIQNSLALTRDECHELLKNLGNDWNPDPLHISFSYNQSRIRATFGEHRSVWDLTNGLEIKDNYAVLKGHKDYVSSLAFSPDSRHLVSGSADKTAIVWDLQASHAIATLKGHFRGLHSVKYSPDGCYIASASEDFTTRIWDVQTHSTVASSKGHLRPVRSIAFSSDGKKIVSGSDDRKVNLWNWEGGLCEAITPHHLRPVTSVAFSPDSQLIASSSDDCTVYLRDVQTRSLQEHLMSSRIFCLQFSPKGTYLAAIDGENIYLWKPTNKPEVVISGKDLRPPVRRICSLAILPDETSLIIGCDDHSVRIVDLTSQEYRSLRFVGHTGWVMAVAVSPDGQHVASGSVDSQIHIWDMPVARKVRDKDDDIISFTKFSPDGTFVMSSTPNKVTRLWNLQTGASRNIILPDYDISGNWMKYICFSPDRRRVAGAFLEGGRATIHLWDLETEERKSVSVEDIPSGTLSLSFTPDSRSLVLNRGGTNSDVWEVHDNGELTRSDLSQRVSVPVTQSPTFFGPQSEETLSTRAARWFPSKKQLGLWAFLGSCIIRVQEDGSLSVLLRRNLV
ncbi:hypothetical protein C0995_012393 [Termitomyces sp. Mi166|nr:hypothetical protein C0995_012393 [Termitomyces sp. Mi166\